MSDEYVLSCWFCQKPGSVVCDSEECQRQHAEILEEEHVCYRKELREAVIASVKQRCKQDSNWSFGRCWRWFYTLKILFCVMIGRTRPEGTESYPDVVEVGHHYFAYTYAGWEAAWIAVGYGFWSGWWYEIQRDSDWNM